VAGATGLEPAASGVTGHLVIIDQFLWSFRQI